MRPPSEELLQKIGIVRSRWKAFLWVRGLSWVLGVMVASLLIGLAAANSANFPGWAVTALRLGLVAAFVFTVVKALILPLRRTPSDTQLARFVEEKNPGLKDRLVSAVEAVQKAKSEQVAFVHLLTKDALDRTKHVRFRDQVNKRKFSTFVALSGLFAVALLISLYISSLFFPVGSVRLLAGLLKPPPIDSYELKVTPGDTTVARGSDVVIQAIAQGFDPQRAEVHLRYSNGTQWELSTMEVTPQTVPTFRHLVFNLQEAVHYFVEAGGYKSKEFTIDVADLPRVEKLDYTYHYPGYTGLAVKKEENASDMVALKGTEVEVVVTASQALSGGRIVFADGKAVPLQPSGEKLATGRVTVDRTTTFRIELINTDRQKYLGPEEYSMEALDDQKPIVEFTKPGRDTKATKVEEVFTELRAEDDFGVNQLELYYSVNGSTEKKIELFTNKGESPKEISASHTFFLEEYDLQPGDFVTYYGKAVDSHRPPNIVSTDIYFIEVRPFGREYYQGQQGGGGGGGGGDDDSAEALSKRQKEIIAATFKLIRDKAKFQTKEWTDNIHAVSASQTKLAEQTNTLMQRLARRGLSGQSKIFKDLSENLQKAIEQMGPAAEQLKAEQAEAALPYEQKALQYLMRAEALFTEIQVTMGNRGGGGGGGRQSAEDLADLFELELDQNKNQYETLQRGEMQQNPQEIDEAIRKLKELAERQQKLMERKAQQAQGGGGGGGSDQMTAQELQKETERLARQLDKLSRENNDRQMADVSRALQQAARNMQQQGQGGTPQQQQQAAQQALEQLQRAQRLLNQGRRGNMDQQLAQLQQQAKRLREEQNKIADQAEQLAASPNNDPKRRAQDINQQKDGVQSELKSMTDGLEALSNNQENRDAANKARSAANTIKSRKLQDQMNQGRQFLENGYYNYAARNEREIEKALADVEKQIGQAASAANNTEEKKLQSALNQTSESIQKLESLKRRLQSGNPQGQSGQPNPQGQRGQQPGHQQDPQNPQNQNQQNPQGQQQGDQQGNQRGQQPGQQPGPQPGQQAGGGQDGDSRNPQSQQNGRVGPYGGAQNQANASGPANYDPRQWSRELAERLREIQDIQGQLGRNNPLANDLNRIAGDIRALMRDPRLGDPQAIEKLAQQIIDPFKSVELELSRTLELLLAKENVRSAQEEEIPAGYKKLVEEYYKKLSNTKP